MRHSRSTTAIPKQVQKTTDRSKVWNDSVISFHQKQRCKDTDKIISSVYHTQATELKVEPTWYGYARRTPSQSVSASWLHLELHPIHDSEGQYQGKRWDSLLKPATAGGRQPAEMGSGD